MAGTGWFSQDHGQDRVVPLSYGDRLGSLGQIVCRENERHRGWPGHYAGPGPGVTRGISYPPVPGGAGDQAHGRDRVVPLSYGDRLGSLGQIVCKFAEGLTGARPGTG
jgi:hypothetical protein